MNPINKEIRHMHDKNIRKITIDLKTGERIVYMEPENFEIDIKELTVYRPNSNSGTRVCKYSVAFEKTKK